MTQQRESAVWQDYTIDPFDLIGATATIVVVRRATHSRTLASQRIYHGVIESVTEDRGTTHLDNSGGGSQDWQEILATDFDEEWKEVVITLRGGTSVRFRPETDAAQITWRGTTHG